MIDQKKTITLRYLQVFFRRKTAFLVTVCIVPVIVFNLSIFLPKRYSASTLIKINDEKILNPLIGDLAVSSTFQQRLRSIQEEILTWENLTDIISGLSIANDIHSQKQYEQIIFSMRRNIELNLVSPDLIRITYVGKDPLEVKTVVSRISDLFIQKNIRTQNKEADTATKFISQQLDVYQNKLDESERVITLYRLSNELKEAQEERNRTKQQLKLQPKEIVSIREQQENPLVAEYERNLIELNAELANLSVDSTENHPRVLSAKAEIDRIKSQLKEAIGSPRSLETRTPNLLYHQLDQRLKDINFRILKIKKELSSIKSLNKEYVPMVMPEQELASLSRNNRVNERIYETLLSRLETANITQRLEDSKSKTTFEIIEKARLPVKPVSLDLDRLIMIALFSGVCAGIGLIILIEFIDNSFKGINDAREFLDRPVLGAIATVMVASDLRKRVLQSKLIIISVTIFVLSLASLGAYFYITFN